jgi:hypothetical protein
LSSNERQACVRQSELGVEEIKGGNASFYRRELPAQTVKGIDQQMDEKVYPSVVESGQETGCSGFRM